MEKLDRLGWKAGLAFEAYGVQLGVRVNEPSALERVRALLPPGWRPSRSRAVHWLFSLRLGDSSGRIKKFDLLYAGIRLRARSLEHDAVFEALEADLRQAVAAHARHRFFLHAGVVGWKGRAILLPGRSFSGKTTLVRELIRAGATYYSDEFAVIDAQGRVHPLAKPLSIRVGDTIEKRTAEELGGVCGVRPLIPAAVVFTEHRPRATVRLVRQGRAAGLLELLRHAVPVRRRPEPTLAALEKLVSRAVVLKGPRGDAAQAARALLARADEWPQVAASRR